MFFSAFVLLSVLLFGYMFFFAKIYDAYNTKEKIRVSLPMIIAIIGYILFQLTKIVWIRRIAAFLIIYELICVKVRIGEEKY